jgi:cystathionine beta-lyase/cystathionine gamma-synthase
MLDRSTIWPYRDGEPGEFYYQRYAHPTGAEAERRLGELDGGLALLFASGAGATTALALAVLEPGKTIALAEGAYFGTGVTFRELERWGLELVEFDQTGPPPEGADLIWLEAPSNPFLTMPDFEAASAHAAPVVVDATASTPVHLRPLERGADFVLHSATKYLAGHDDAMLGAVVCKREADAERLKEFRTHTGIVAAPDPCYLLLRGLKTLDVRVRRQTETATELARRLGEHAAGGLDPLRVIPSRTNPLGLHPLLILRSLRAVRPIPAARRRRAARTARRAPRRRAAAGSPTGPPAPRAPR